MGSEEVKKICKSLPVDEGNRVTYRINDPGEIKGLFSFSYYVPPTMTATSKGYVYSEGISLYIRMIEENKELWNGWRVVLYMDEISMERGVVNPTKYNRADPDDDPEWLRRKEEFLRLLRTSPHVIVATVRWNEYKMNESGSAVNPNIMRCFRFKAFEDFADIPVYVRDADTIFVDEQMGSHGWIRRPTLRTITPEIVSDWEEEYHTGFSRKGRKYRFALATQPDYSRPWHTPKNAAAAENSAPNMIGFFAGVVGSLGDIGAWKSGSLWESCVSYLRGKCRVEPGVTREGAPIVKFVTTRRVPHMDEPLLAFVILPEIWETTFFFHYEFVEVMSIKLEYRSFYEYMREPSEGNKAVFETGLKGYKAMPSVKEDREGAYKAKNKFSRTNYSGKQTPLAEKLEKNFEKARELLINTAKGQAVAAKAKRDPYYRPEIGERNAAILAAPQKELLQRTLEGLNSEFLEIERKAERENANIWGLNEEEERPKPKLDSRIDANMVRKAFKGVHYHTFLQKLISVLMELNGFRLTCKVRNTINTRRGGALPRPFKKRKGTRRRH
jgi:hypothetical protein